VIDQFEKCGKPKKWWQGRKKGYSWKDVGREEYKAWWRTTVSTSVTDWEAGGDAITWAARASWWEWDDGSMPFYWRWPVRYRTVMRDGLKVHFQDEAPRYRRAQHNCKNPTKMVQVKKKLNKLLEPRYIAPGYVVSLTSFFPVQKGENDIRMVYDGSVIGLNDVMWVPRFVLPTLNTHLRAVEEHTFMADVDVGEMFLNFVLHKDLRSVSGVDLTCFFPSKQMNIDTIRSHGTILLVWDCMIPVTDS
jgi:hypothetical protein